MSSFYRVSEGEWVNPIRKGYNLACCDCGLVHVMDFRIHNGHIEFRAFRNNRSTAMIRRFKNKKEKIDARRTS